MRWGRTIAGAALVVLALLLVYNRFDSARVASKVARLESEKTRLLDSIQRLCGSRRVAQLRVLAQFRDDAGQPVSRVLWQEIRTDGVITRPVELQVAGSQVYIEAYVVKFDHGLVAEGDPDRGMSVALFRRIFGDREAPQSVPLLERVAGGLNLEDQQPATAETPLWTQFWDLVDSPERAGKYGIRVAQCEAPAVAVRSGQIWEVTLDAAGGLNLRKLQDAAGVAHANEDAINSDR